MNILNPFLDSFEEASTIKEKRRNLPPPVYNPARLAEKPLPLLVLVNEPDSTQVEEDENQAASNDENVSGAVDPLMQLNLSDETNDSLAEENDEIANELSSVSDQGISRTTIENATIESNANNDESFAELADIWVDFNRRDDGSSFEETFANIYPAIFDDSVNDTANDDNANGMAIQHVSNAENIASTSANSGDNFTAANGSMIHRDRRDDGYLDTQNNEVADELPSSSVENSNFSAAQNISGIVVKQEPVFEPLNEEQAQAIDDVFNHSYEQCDSDGEIYVEKSTPIPAPCKSTGDKENPYKTKAADVISGNIPFATSVSIFFFMFLSKFIIIQVHFDTLRCIV